ncbi:amidohydrolase [Clostridium tetanomorphum]|uniref:Amidohydrolase n=1 Tax=Clostridium tetanomorphum TaxID=1553 RepID=A0A923EB06_CLOTT|nr:amidohydrolase [Clostridium tetanomorphum]MBC2397664.1 amidohydrolase [Clostridium tetanomorphum]NRZ96584.1 imidazolonepropionase-like amidohydrolase [Clostridium tetanomorphum]
MIFIKNGKIFTMADKIYENGGILIKENKILEIGENIQVPKETEIVDAKGGWVIPGIIDAHCHIGLIEEGMGFEGNDINETTDSVTAELRAIDGINPLDHSFEEAIKAGITTVMTGPGSANVVGGQFVAMKTKGICVDDMILKAPAAMKIAFGENPKRVYNSKGKRPITRMATAAILRETLVKAKNYKKRKDASEIKGDNFDIDLRMEALIPVIQKKIPLKAHAHRADDILTAIRIAKEFDLNITLDHCTEGEIIGEYIKDAQVPAIIGPTLTFKGKIETKNKSFTTPKILSNLGVKVAIMTDHPVIPIQYLPMCAGLAVKEGWDLEEGLKSITINAAEIIGIEDRVGSIEKGKDADIAIFDGNPLDSLTNTMYTIINGRIEYKKE